MADKIDIVKINTDNYGTLKNKGYIVIGGKTYNYNQDNVYVVDDTDVKLNGVIKSIMTEYCLYDKPTNLPDTGITWYSQVSWTAGMYIWTRNKYLYADGTTEYTDPICVTGNTGEKGATGANTYSINIDNDFVSISTDNDGNYTDTDYPKSKFESVCKHTISCYDGTTKLSISSYKKMSSSTDYPTGTGYRIGYILTDLTVDDTNAPYSTVTGITQGSTVSSGSIQYYLCNNGNMLATAKFEVTKLKLGNPGTTYYMLVSPNTIKHYDNGDYDVKPESAFSVELWKQISSSAPTEIENGEDTTTGYTFKVTATYITGYDDKDEPEWSSEQALTWNKNGYYTYAMQQLDTGDYATTYKFLAYITTKTQENVKIDQETVSVIDDGVNAYSLDIKNDFVYLQTKDDGSFVGPLTGDNLRIITEHIITLRKGDNELPISGVYNDDGDDKKIYSATGVEATGLSANSYILHVSKEAQAEGRTTYGLFDTYEDSDTKYYWNFNIVDGQLHAWELVEVLSTMEYSAYKGIDSTVDNTVAAYLATTGKFTAEPNQNGDDACYYYLTYSPSELNRKKEGTKKYLDPSTLSVHGKMIKGANNPVDIDSKDNPIVTVTATYQDIDEAKVITIYQGTPKDDIDLTQTIDGISCVNCNFLTVTLTVNSTSADTETIQIYNDNVSAYAVGIENDFVSAVTNNAGDMDGYAWSETEHVVTAKYAGTAKELTAVVKDEVEDTAATGWYLTYTISQEQDNENNKYDTLIIDTITLSTDKLSVTTVLKDGSLAKCDVGNILYSLVYHTQQIADEKGNITTAASDEEFATGKFEMSKVKEGEAATSYSCKTSTQFLKRQHDKTYIPEKPTFSVTKTVGSKIDTKITEGYYGIGIGTEVPAATQALTGEITIDTTLDKYKNVDAGITVSYALTENGTILDHEYISVYDQPENPYTVDIANDFASIPCNSDGTSAIDTNTLKSETKHTVRVLYGSTGQAFVYGFPTEDDATLVTDTLYLTATNSTARKAISTFTEPTVGTEATSADFEVTALTAGTDNGQENGAITYAVYKATGTGLDDIEELNSAKFNLVKRINGTSPYSINIDNDFASIPCTANGTVISDFTANKWQSETTHTVHAWHGSTEIAYTFDPNNTSTSGIRIVPSNNNVTRTDVMEAEDSTAYTKNHYITALTAETGNVTYTLYDGTNKLASAKFEASKNKTGAIYKLLPSVGNIIKDTNDSNKLSPATVSFTFTSTAGNETDCYYRITNGETAGNWTQYASTSLNSISPAGAVTVEIALDSNGNSIVEKETIEVVATGKNGTTYYNWIKYSNYSNGKDASGTTSMYNSPVDSVTGVAYPYIGTALQNTETESEDPTQYTWRKYIGEGGSNLLVTYHDKTDEAPNLPTNAEGTDEGWYTDPSADGHSPYWMSTRTGSTSDTGAAISWGRAIKVQGDDGTNAVVFKITPSVSTISFAAIGTDGTQKSDGTNPDPTSVTFKVTKSAGGEPAAAESGEGKDGYAQYSLDKGKNWTRVSLTDGESTLSAADDVSFANGISFAFLSETGTDDTPVAPTAANILDQEYVDASYDGPKGEPGAESTVPGPAGASTETYMLYYGNNNNEKSALASTLPTGGSSITYNGWSDIQPSPAKDKQYIWGINYTKTTTKNSSGTETSTYTISTSTDDVVMIAKCDDLIAILTDSTGNVLIGGSATDGYYLVADHINGALSNKVTIAGFTLAEGSWSHKLAYTDGTTETVSDNSPIEMTGTYNNKTISTDTITKSSDGSLYYGKSSLTSAAEGIYIGTNGISIGTYSNSEPAFKVTAGGEVTCTSIKTQAANSAVNTLKNDKDYLTAVQEGISIGISKAGVDEVTQGYIPSMATGSTITPSPAYILPIRYDQTEAILYVRVVTPTGDYQQLRIQNVQP